MTRLNIRLIRFGSAKTLTRAGDGIEKPEPEEPSQLYNP